MLIKIPTAIDIKNNKVTGSKNTIDDIAGPGHNPAKPQPIPNKEDPIISLLSKSFLCGNLISKFKYDLFLFFNQ